MVEVWRDRHHRMPEGRGSPCDPCCSYTPGCSWGQGGREMILACDNSDSE